jgi:hypothetical protein
MDAYSQSDISREIAHLLRRDEQYLLRTAYDMVDGIEVDDTSGVSFSGGLMERLLQFYKTYIAPFVEQNNEKAQEMWGRSREKFQTFSDGAHEVSLTEEVLLTCITADFLREVLIELHEGELTLSKISLHGLAALAIIVVKRVKPGPWTR